MDKKIRIDSKIDNCSSHPTIVEQPIQKTLDFQKVQKKKIQILKNNENTPITMFFKFQLLIDKLKLKISQLRQKMAQTVGLKNITENSLVNIFKKPIHQLTKNQSALLQQVLKDQNYPFQCIQPLWNKIQNLLLQAIKIIPINIFSQNQQVCVKKINDLIIRRQHQIQLKLQPQITKPRKIQQKRVLLTSDYKKNKQNQQTKRRQVQKRVLLQNKSNTYPTCSNQKCRQTQTKLKSPLSQLECRFSIQDECPHQLNQINTLTLFQCCGKKYWCKKCHDSNEHHLMKQSIPSKRFCLNCKEQFEVNFNQTVPIKCFQCEDKN